MTNIAHRGFYGCIPLSMPCQSPVNPLSIRQADMMVDRLDICRMQSRSRESSTKWSVVMAAVMVAVMAAVMDVGSQHFQVRAHSRRFA